VIYQRSTKGDARRFLNPVALGRKCQLSENVSDEIDKGCVSFFGRSTLRGGAPRGAAYRL